MSGAAVRRPSPVHDAEILDVPLAQRFGSGFAQDLDDLVFQPLALSLPKEVGAAARRRIGDRLLPGRPPTADASGADWKHDKHDREKQRIAQDRTESHNIDV